MLLENIIQRGFLLNLDGLYRDVRDLETRVLSDLNTIKLRRVVVFRYSIERPRQSSPGRCFLCQSKANSGTAPLKPHKMPTSLANHCVKYKSRNLFNQGPLSADWLQAWV